MRDVSELVNKPKPQRALDQDDLNRMIAESDRELINTFGRPKRRAWPTSIGNR